MNTEIIRQSLIYYSDIILIHEIHILGAVSKKFNRLIKEMMIEYNPRMVLSVAINNDDKFIFEKKIRNIKPDDDINHCHLLSKAIQNNNMDMIKIICNYVDSVKNLFDFSDLMMTVFHYTTPNYVEYFESYGVNYKNKIDVYLISACNTGNTEMIKFAHRNGADIVNNTTAIDNLIMFGNIESIKYLCENGANIRYPIIFSRACNKGNINIIKYLYELDNSIVNEDGLKLLVKKSHLEIIKYFNNKINQEQKNIILEEARKLGKLDIIDYLSKIEN